VSGLLGSLIRWAERHPDALALCDVRSGGADRKLSWLELCNAAAGFGRRLENAPPGAVMVASPNRCETQIALLGALWAGRDVLPVSPAAPPAALASLVQRAGISSVVGAAALGDGVASPIDPASLWRDSNARTVPAAPGASGAILVESSGTTGTPKIVRRDAQSLEALGSMVSAALQLEASDRILLTVPLHHSYGIDIGLAGLLTAGCSVEIHERFAPATARIAIEERGITVWPAVPLMFDALSRTGISALGDNERIPTTLRKAISAGSPLPRRIFDQFERTFGVRIGQIYGASEYGSVSYGDPDAPGFEPASVGMPMPGVTIRIVDLGRNEPGPSLPVGAEGEIWVAAPSRLSRYVDSEEAPASAGFVRSGDLGRIDSAGRLWLTGRVKLLIDVGAQSVNPLEVEEILTRHPQVAEAVVIATGFSDTADRLKAIVVPSPDQTPDLAQLREFASERLAAHKVPRSFEMRSDLPRSPTGKILRRELQAAEGETRAARLAARKSSGKRRSA
jgi:long-chain acyl-CoA synthetase